MSSLATNPHFDFNELTPEIRADVVLSIQRLVRLAQFPDSQIEEKKLAWEVIRYLRQECGQKSGSNADLARAITGLMPQVNVQVNVDNEQIERQRLEHRAANGLTQLARDRARLALERRDAKSNQQLPASTAADQAESDQTVTEPIQAAEK